MTLQWVHGAFATGGVIVGLAATGLVGLSGNALGARSVLLEPPAIDQVQAPLERDLAGEDSTGDEIYQIEIEGLNITNRDWISLAEVAGDEDPLAQQQLPQGGEPLPEEVITGPTEIVIERTFHGIDEFYHWRTAVEQGDVERRTIIVTVLDRTQRPIQQIELRNAWPRVWETPDMFAVGQIDQTETITLMVEELRRRAL